MKVVEVKDQVRLSLRKCFELVFSGIQYRLFRAIVTVTIMALAVAFLMTMLTEGLVARQVAGAIREQTAPRDAFVFWVSRLKAPMSEEELNAQLVAMTPGDERWEESKTWGKRDGEKPSDEELAELVPLAREQKKYLAFFAGLPKGDLSVLVERARGTEIFARLASERDFDDFFVKLRQLGRRLPDPGQTGDDMQAFKAFLNKRRAAGPLRQRIRAGHEKALESVKTLLQGQEPRRALAELDTPMVGELRERGFHMTEAEMRTVRDQALLRLDYERIERTITIPLVKQRLADRIGEKVANVNAHMLFSTLSSSGGVRWFFSVLDKVRQTLKELESAQQDRRKLTPQERDLLVFKGFIEGFDLPAERIEKVARAKLAESRLSIVEASVLDSSGVDEGVLGFSTRTVWLILVSLLVCVVGIANAMLMSVTERFREIATMKCLGATDGFIMTNFILESCMQGLAGGIIGVLLGFLLGSLRSGGKYGWMAMSHIPVMEISVCAAGAIVVGVVLSALAAVYPAWVAARLAPMEAMRIE